VEVIIASGDAALAFTQEYLTEDEPLRAARASAADLGGSVPLSPAGGAAIRFLAAAIGARTVVEIGTGCGTSGIWLLRGMRPGAVLTSVDVEPEHQRMARKAFGQAGFAANQSRLIVGRALDVLPRLSDGAYDMVFCDADPQEYPEYLAGALRLLRVGGIVAFDDALPLGAGPPGAAPPGAGPPDAAPAGAGPASDDPDAAAIYELAELIRNDERLVPLLLPVGDGLLAAVKRTG
jgi:predicted O-methyltransferase YrrM